MIGLQYNSAIPTTLDLNGPYLSISTQPESTTVNDDGTATVTGVATATFTNNDNATNTGRVALQWHEVGVGALSNSDTVSGVDSTTLTLSNLSSPDDNGRQFFLRSDYVPSAYQSSSPVTAGTARSTGNAVNEPFDSDTITVTVNPTLSITSQPADATAGQGIDATFSVTASSSDDSDVSYQWTQDGTALTDSSTVSGSRTPTLTISGSDTGTSTIGVTISHPTAGNSPLSSDTATFTVVDLRQIINYERHSDTGSLADSGSQNLADGSITFTADPGNPTRATVIYCPEEEVTVRMTIAAGAGSNGPSVGGGGGEGGRSVVEFTMERNTEYLLKLGASTMPTGGSNGGGGAAYLYKKGQLLFALGGGGGGGRSGRGGDGGGIGVAGQRGGGRNGGAGGQLFDAGTIPTIGVFPGGDTWGGVNWSSPSGGRISGCTPGNSVFRNEFSPCEDMGNRRFRTSNGSEISGTSVIQRGYKPGIGHRNNGGNGSGDEGGGGSGAAGGNAGGGGGSGGGGASGYSNGEVTVISTRSGGNTSTNAFVTIETAS